MKNVLESLKALNSDWNDIPRRLLLILAMFMSLALLLFVLPYIAPFVLSALFAWMIDRIAKFLLKWVGDSRALRGIISAVLVLLLIGIVFFITLYLFDVVISEVKSLAAVLPGFVGSLTQDALTWIEELNLDTDILDIGINLEDTLTRMLGELSTMATTLASRIASGAARIVLQAFSLLPESILFVVMTIFGTFYMSADKERIFSFFRGLLPEKFYARSTSMRSGFFIAIFSQVRAAFIIFLVIFAVLAIGFVIIQVDYAILFALLIAFIDLLPVLGAGLFLLPMTLYGLVMGNLLLGLGAAFLYLMIVIVRQILQPKLVGNQIGIHPLLTMIAMYVGYKVQGVFGMMLAPIMLILCKIVLSDGREDEPMGKKMVLQKMTGRLRKRPKRRAHSKEEQRANAPEDAQRDAQGDIQEDTQGGTPLEPRPRD